ncbi:unnamed protein product, partial [Ectocarpus sp. 13 AM-2016]
PERFGEAGRAFGGPSAVDVQGRHRTAVEIALLRHGVRDGIPGSLLLPEAGVGQVQDGVASAPDVAAVPTNQHARSPPEARRFRRARGRAGGEPAAVSPSPHRHLLHSERVSDEEEKRRRGC